MISGAATVAGVLGRPVTHSLSPVMHNAWIAAAGLDAVYVPLTCALDRLPQLIDGLRGSGIAGLNVTLPFKENALALADRADPIAVDAGAANVLRFGPDGSVVASNTDGVGLLQAFREQAPAVDLRSGPVVILGAGGAARGAAAALKRHGVAELRVVNRTLGRAEALTDQFGGQPFALDRAGTAFGGAVAVINATAIGLAGQYDYPLDQAPDSCAVMDMVYRPVKTQFLRRAKGLGMTTVDGLSMLIHQAIPGFEAFYGQPPPAGLDIRSVLLAAMSDTEVSS